jgi:hypothetical protein
LGFRGGLLELGRLRGADMVCAMNIFALIPVAIPVARSWVRSQRKRYRQADNARRLAESEKRVLGSFFSSAILEKAVIAEVSSIPNPGFYVWLKRFGIDLTLDLSQARGITFDDTILIRREGSEAIRDWYSLLFHELVHVVQYEVLGLDVFIDRYIRAMVAADMNSLQNRFEIEAYALQGRFESDPNRAFSVEHEVRKN